jgi:hypothetical protein
MTSVVAEYTRFMQSLAARRVDPDAVRVAQVVADHLSEIARTVANGGNRPSTVAPLLRQHLAEKDGRVVPAEEVDAVPRAAWTRLTRLVAGPFRGFAREEEFNLDRRVVLVYGPNGSGKSTFCEALEFVLLGNVLEADERRIDPPAVYMRNIHANAFAAPQLFANAGGAEIAVTAAPEQLRFCIIEKNRIDAFARLAARTPAQAESLIATLFGLNTFSDFVNDFTQNLDRCLNLDTPRARLLAEREVGLTAARELVDGRDVREQELQRERDAIAAAYAPGVTLELLARALGLDGQPGRLQEIDDELARADPRASGFTEAALREAHRTFREAASPLLDVNQRLEARVRERPFRDLYQAVRQLRPSSPDACPACSTPINAVAVNPYDRAEAGLETLRGLAELEEERERLQPARDVAARALITLCGACAAASVSTDGNLVDVVNWADANRELIAGRIEPARPILWRNVLKAAAGLEARDALIREQLLRRGEMRIERDRLLDAKAQLDALGGRRDEHAEQVRLAQQRIAMFEEENAPLRREVEREREAHAVETRLQRAYAGFYGEIRAYRDGLPATLLANLNTRTLDLYNEFNVGDPDVDLLAGLRLPLAAGDNIEVAFRGAPLVWVNALQVLSEGHVRCLGLAILIAKNIELGLPLMVFDDAVNAIDHDHRNGIRRSLFGNPDLREKQLIVTCHSNEFIKDIHNEEPPNSSHLYVMRPHDGDHHPRVVSGNSRHYLVRARAELDDGNLRECLAACRRLLENLAVRMWKALGNQSEELGTLSVAIAKPDGQPETYDIVVQLTRKIGQGRERGMLTADVWATRYEALEQIRQVPERNLIWRHLNGGTHDAIDREDFELPLVQRVVDALGRISGTFEGG